jgi:hypothetical protein
MAKHPQRGAAMILLAAKHLPKKRPMTTAAKHPPEKLIAATRTTPARSSAI